MLKTVSSVTNALGALVYQGTWDASANNPTLTSSVGTKGNYYVVSVAGTTTLDGISSWSVGDWAVFNGSVWQKVDGGTSESFVNLTVTGTANIATGNVVNMTSSNVTITGGTENAVTYTNVTISSGNVTVTNDNVAYSNISTALRTQSLTGYLYGNANTGNVTASTSIPVANVTGAVSSVTGTSPISSSGGTTPAISLNTSGVTAASYGGAANSATITVDTYGRITAASNTAIAIANTQVSGLGTMSTQNSNNVTITGGNVGANLSTSTAIPVANATGILAVGNGGTGLTSVTSGYIPYGNGSSALNITANLTYTSNKLNANVLQVGGSSGSPVMTSTGYYVDAGYAAYISGTTTTGGLSAITFFTGSTERMRIFYSGGVSIGNTTDPGAANLSVTGNVVQATAAKGFNFTANTPASGMTSQLLNWYEEGTWTPTDLSGAGLTFTVDHAKYTRVGRLVTVGIYLTFPTTSNTSTAKISLPFSAPNYDVGVANSNSASGVAAVITIGSTNAFTIRNSALTTLTNVNLSGAQILITISYQV